MSIANRHGATRAIKIKSMTTDEIDLNPVLADAGIEPVETDLADMIVQLSHDTPSHILVPAIHRNRAEIRSLFEEKFGQGRLTDKPTDLTAAARRYLRTMFLETPLAISGANFAIAETGTVGIVESEGNGRMCLTLPRASSSSLMGIEKVLPKLEDLSVIPAASPSRCHRRADESVHLAVDRHQAERRAAGNFTWSCSTTGARKSSPIRSRAKPCTASAARAASTSARSMNGPAGHAYNSMYQGPIGAILTPQLRGMEQAGTLPFASSLCGACLEACPVKIDIPRILVHPARQIDGCTTWPVAPRRRKSGDASGTLGCSAAPAACASPSVPARLGQRLFAREGTIAKLPGPLSAWSASRDFPALPEESFRDWWRRR